MNLHLLSDIHLELSTNGMALTCKLVPDKHVDGVLILAGDIGNPCTKLYKRFVAEMAAKYLQVLIVLGNHEYYQPLKRVYDHQLNILTRKFRVGMDSVEKELRTFVETLPNVKMLQLDEFIFNRVRFLGCTLWSPGDPKLSEMMNDYRQINAFSPDKSAELHKIHTAWLTERLDINSPDYDKTVVITHHLPTYELIAPKYREEASNVFYADHLDELVAKADIWTCGHSHTQQTVIVGNCRCYLNPVGYSMEHTGWSPDLSILV